MTITDQIKILNRNVMQNEAPYDLDRKAANISAFPMDTSSSIRHRFDVEIPCGKFAEITSILKGKSTWKL